MLFTYLYSHALSVLTVAASLLTATRLMQSRRTPQSMFAWLLGVMFLPFLAIPLFFALGSRKFPRRAKGLSDDVAPRDAHVEPLADDCIARVLQKSGVAPPRNGNSFEILPDGEKAYSKLLQLIAEAELSIDLTIFILGEDATGHAMIEALVGAAKRGVKVRVIVDGVGSARAERSATRALHDAGGELRVFMPLRHSPFRGRTNLRSHRKLVVFDRCRVFAGGMNLATEYMGLPGRGVTGKPLSTEKSPDTDIEPRWRDVASVTSGPVARDAEAMFESDWVFCGGSKRDKGASDASPAACAPGVAGDEVVQLVPSGPDMLTDTVYDLLLTGIFSAKTRISLVTPYYVPDDQLQHALVLAARRGVRTEVLVPTRSNHGAADLARRGLLRELRKAGVILYFYPKGMVHAKAMVFDDSFAYVGSPNFDMRSLFLNYENALCVYSSNAIGQVRGYVDGLIEESTTTGPKEKPNWLIEQVARLLAPEL